MTVIVAVVFLLGVYGRSFSTGPGGPISGTNNTTYVIIPPGAGENRTFPGPTATLAGWGYEPAEVTVVVGVNNTVTWINKDSATVFGLTFSVPHAVTNPQRAFNSGLMNSGDRFTHVFTLEGVYYYHCDYHPWQKGIVIVKVAGASGTTPGG